MSHEIHRVLTENMSNIQMELYAINAGGCGIFAAALVAKLRQAGYEANAVLVDHGYSKECVSQTNEEFGVGNTNDLVYECIEYKLDGNRNKYPNGHICVEFEGQLYDSRGNVTDQFSPIGDPFTDDALLALLRVRSMWNRTFRVLNQSTKVTKVLADFFGQLII